MAGHFELVTDPDGSCRVKLIDRQGRELAVSAPYGDRKAAVRGINAFRDVAATAAIKDRTSSAPGPRTSRPLQNNNAGQKEALVERKGKGVTCLRAAKAQKTGPSMTGSGPPSTQLVSGKTRTRILRGSVTMVLATGVDANRK